MPKQLLLKSTGVHVQVKNGSKDIKFFHIPSALKFYKKENNDKITIVDNFVCTLV